MIGNNIIFAVAAFVLSIPMAWIVSVLGHWFPLEKDFGGKSFAHILMKGGDGYVENP